MATTKYTPRRINIPQGQAPGSGAEVIRRARGTNPLVAALLQGPRGGGGGRSPARPQVGVSVNIGGGARREEARAHEERMREETREFQREQVEDQRAYREEQEDLRKQNDIASMRARYNMEQWTRAQDSKIANKESERKELITIRNRAMSGDPHVIAGFEAQGLSAHEGLDKLDDRIEDWYQLWTEEDFQDRQKAVETTLNWLGRKTQQPTMSMEVGEEEFPAGTLPGPPSRTFDYQIGPFLAHMTKSTMLADQSGALAARDVQQAWVKLAAVQQEFRERAPKQFDSMLISMGMKHEPDMQRTADKALRSLIDLALDAEKSGQPADLTEVQKIIAETGNFDEAQSVVKQILDGSAPLFRKDVKFPQIAAMMWGYDKMLGYMDKAIGTTDMKDRIVSSLSMLDILDTAGDRRTRERIEDQVHMWISGNRANLNDMKVVPDVDMHLAIKNGTFDWDSYRVQTDDILEAIELGGTLEAGFLGKLEKTTDQLLEDIRSWGTASNAHFQLVTGDNDFGIRTRALIRNAPPIPRQFQPQQQTQSAEPGPLQTQSLTPEQEEESLAPSITPGRSFSDSLIRP